MTIRLGILINGQRARAKIALKVIGLVGRTEPDPVVRLMLYRPGLFGRAFNRLAASVMRGPSGWTPGERERIGASVSRSNECPFCLGVHSTIAGMRDTTSPSGDLAGVEAASGRVGAVCSFIDLVQARPDAVTAADVEAVRAAGVADDELGDALSVAFVFNTINRIVNALDFTYETDADKVKLAQGLDRMSYKVPTFLMS